MEVCFSNSRRLGYTELWQSGCLVRTCFLGCKCTLQCQRAGRIEHTQHLKAPIPSGGLHPHELSIFPKLCLQIPAHWGVEFQHRRQYCVHFIVLLQRNTWSQCFPGPASKPGLSLNAFLSVRLRTLRPQQLNSLSIRNVSQFSCPTSCVQSLKTQNI